RIPELSLVPQRADERLDQRLQEATLRAKRAGAGHLHRQGAVGSFRAPERNDGPSAALAPNEEGVRKVAHPRSAVEREAAGVDPLPQSIQRRTSLRACRDVPVRSRRRIDATPPDDVTPAPVELIEKEAIEPESLGQDARQARK